MGYYITEKRLLELFETEARYEALQSGGVDNWEWYGEANRDYLTSVNVMAPEGEEDKVTFGWVAEEQLFHEFSGNEITILGRRD